MVYSSILSMLSITMIYDIFFSKTIGVIQLNDRTVEIIVCILRIVDAQIYSCIIRIIFSTFYLRFITQYTL